MIDISNGVRLFYPTIHIFLSVYPADHWSALTAVHWSDCPLHFFSLIYFDTLSLRLVLNGVRLAGLITFQADAVGLPVLSWVRRIGTVSATFKLADRPILGEDQEGTRQHWYNRCHFSSWLGLSMDRGRQGEGVGVSHGTFKLPCCQFLVSKEKFRPGRVGEIKQKIITQGLG